MNKALLSSASVLALLGMTGVAQAQSASSFTIPGPLCNSGPVTCETLDFNAWVNVAVNEGELLGSVNISVLNNIVNSFVEGEELDAFITTNVIGAQNDGTIGAGVGVESIVDIGDIDVFSGNTTANSETLEFDDDIFAEDIFVNEVVELNVEMVDGEFALINTAMNTSPVNADVSISAEGAIIDSFGGIATRGVSASNQGVIEVEGGDVTVTVDDIRVLSDNTFGGDVYVDDDVFDENIFDNEVIDIEFEVSDNGPLLALNYVYNDVRVDASVNIFSPDIEGSFNGAISTRTVTEDEEGEPLVEADQYDVVTSTVISTFGAGALNEGTTTISTGDLSVTVGDIDIFSGNTFENALNLNDKLFDEPIFGEDLIEVDADLDGLVAVNFAWNDNNGTVDASVVIGGELTEILNSFNDAPDSVTEPDVFVRNGISTLAIGAQNIGDITISAGTVYAEVGDIRVFSDNAFGEETSESLGFPEEPFQSEVFDEDVVDIDAEGVSVSAKVGDISIFSNNDFYQDTYIGDQGAQSTWTDLFDDEVFDGQIVDLDYEVIDTNLVVANISYNEATINGSVMITAVGITDSFSNIGTSVAGAVNTGTINVGLTGTN